MSTILEIDRYLEQQGSAGTRQVKIRSMRLLGASLDMRSRRSMSRAFAERFTRVFLPPLSNKEKRQRENNWRRLEEKRAKKAKKKN